MMNEEMIAKAKEAKSVEELIALAKENGVELTEEDAKAYFEQLNVKKGELSDDELDNVSGGMRPVVASAPRTVVAGTLLCPNCQNRDIYHGSDEPRECKKCGCHWNSLTGEILN